ncbi:MAG TPA: hypothetical protein ENI61_06940 [Ignavibacteria bacterium]|nr:hypothetical protein [Ignavibacteria bacterium]
MNKLSEKQKKYFWDCNFDELNFEDHKKFILIRLLTFADFEGIKFILKNYSAKEVNDYINSKGAMTLTHNNLCFWQKLTKYDELWEK